MSVRRILSSLVVSALLCGASSLALAQTVAPKGAKDAPIKGYVFTSWVSLTAAPAGPSAAMAANERSATSR